MGTLILLLKMVRIIAAAILAAVYFIDAANMPKKLRIDFRPFNCFFCLSSWLALGFHFMPGYVLNAIIVITLTGLIVNKFKNFFRNINF